MPKLSLMQLQTAMRAGTSEVSKKCNRENMAKNAAQQVLANRVYPFLIKLLSKNLYEHE